MSGTTHGLPAANDLSAFRSWQVEFYSSPTVLGVVWQQRTCQVFIFVHEYGKVVCVWGGTKKSTLESREKGEKDQPQHETWNINHRGQRKQKNLVTKAPHGLNKVCPKGGGEVRKRIIPEQNAPMSKGLRTSLVNSENSRVKLVQVLWKISVTYCAGEINFCLLLLLYLLLTDTAVSSSLKCPLHGNV